MKTTIDLDLDTAELGRSLARTLSSALTTAAADGVRYGNHGIDLQRAVREAAIDLAKAVFADPAFVAEARSALSRGMLQGLEERGVKLGRAIPIEKAMQLALGEKGR